MVARALERDPQPFSWRKTAEEILDRLAGCCTAIKQ
jgi:hypothetical protein